MVPDNTEADLSSMDIDYSNPADQEGTPPKQHLRKQKADEKQYCSRKPKWWLQLSGRRGTRGQRQAIQRMTHLGYCLSKEILTDFSRVNNNQSRKNIIDSHESGDTEGLIVGGDVSCHDDEWRRAWWNRSLGIIADNESAQLSSPSIVNNISIISRSNNKKYDHKIQQMYNYKNPLPSNHYKHIYLEIGFGNGNNLLTNAKNHPDSLFIGSEIHQPGVGAVLRQIEMEMGLLNAVASCKDGDEMKVLVNEEKQENAFSEEINQESGTMHAKSKLRQSSMQSPHSQTERSHQNIRILPGDGIKLLSLLPKDYLDAILITFPDPWPKEGHAHWRVIQREVVREMHRVLKPNRAGRVYVATDALNFNSWTREIFQQESLSSSTASSSILWEEIVPCPDRGTWLPVVSYYEQKGLDEGRCAMLQCWQSI
eukprot:CAMPEP_0183704914 /NCGR_PEP_ID=MMETSP0737-20130205/2140_1 /TAXON_ID=385413 /ORGANISM="Thalassiosira miniscula, Strain CCMP1093" /LENGTH=424 /DNA_ID=CAMNT_0025931945 /DNA_START=56 /DNA_END=1330 /DNA_ORIENTATION=-